MQTYIIQRGDTLYGISKQFGVSIENIRKANNMISDAITIGQVLKIPTTESTLLYIVQIGDSLYSIATKYNTTVQNLIELNNLKGNIITVGQEIRIPIGQQEEIDTYTVRKGDNLYSIANKYNTTVEEIKQLNGLQTNLLSIGQVLKIPSSSSSDDNYITYKVRSGDSLYSIANKYNTTVSEIKNLNNLDTNLLSIGQTLIIPSLNQSNNSYITYTVRRGDNLYKIANQYNVTVDELIKLNNLTNTLLTIGQELKIKESSITDSEIGNVKECYGEGYQEPVYQTYTVKKGDSLYIIANRFDTTVDNLIKLNNLKTNNLSIGQILKIREVTR